MRRKPTYVLLIPILLSLLLSNYVMSLANEINIQPDGQISTKLRAYIPVPSGSKIWKDSVTSSLSSEISMPGSHVSYSPINLQLTNPQEIKEHENQMETHVFNKIWQDAVHLPRRFEKVKRSFGFVDSISAIGRNIGGIAKNSNAENLSDPPKDLGKGLRSEDNPKVDRANSLLEESKLEPVQTPSSSESLPILSSKEAQEIHQLQVLEQLDMEYKPFSELTEYFIKYKPDKNLIDQDLDKNVREGLEKQHRENRDLSILAHLALYSEKLLFQSALDGESNVKLGQLATQLEKNRSKYVNELKKGVETKEFLNDVYVKPLVKEVSTMRNSIWARTLTPSQFKTVQHDQLTSANQAKRVSFLESSDDSDRRQVTSKTIMDESLAIIATDPYLNIGKPRSSIGLNPPKDVTKNMVIKLANRAQDSALIFQSRPLSNIQNGEQARETREAFKIYMETYAQKNEIDYPLLIVLQKISTRRQIRLATRLSFWSDKLKAKFRKLVSQLTLISKKKE